MMWCVGAAAGLIMDDRKVTEDGHELTYQVHLLISMHQGTFRPWAFVCDSRGDSLIA
jgi:hypothetical protein